MGLEERLPGGILLSTVEKVAGYVRKGSLWPATFGLACCAIEMMATAGPRFDISRFGMERFSATPRQADLMIVAGRVSQKMAPVLRQIYDQMAEPNGCWPWGCARRRAGCSTTTRWCRASITSCRWTSTSPAAAPARDAVARDPQAARQDSADATRVNREEAVREAEQAALAIPPTIELKGLLR